MRVGESDRQTTGVLIQAMAWCNACEWKESYDHDAKARWALMKHQETLDHRQRLVGGDDDAR